MDLYEYKVISGEPEKEVGWNALEQEMNSLVQEGWEVDQISTCPIGGFGMGIGSGGGGIGPFLVILLRRHRS